MFTAEQIVEKGRNFHLACFTCNDCNRPLRNKLQVYVNNEEIYCKTCHSKNNRVHGQSQSDTGLIKGTESDSCPRCEGKVFEAEKMQSSKFMFHKSCFNCCQCKHMLDYSSMYECKAGEIYCKGCYINLFFVAGKNSFMDTKKLPARDGESSCVKCNGKVFDMEKVWTKHGDYHPSCLSCKVCDMRLNTSNYFAGPNKQLYCGKCYDSSYGRRARSKSRGPVDVAQFQASDDDPNQCLACGGKIFEAEKFSTSFGSFHAQCFRCAKCSYNLYNSPDNACSRNGQVLCKRCFIRERKNSLSAGNDEDGALLYAKSIVESHVIQAEDGDPLQCPRCSGKVFEAERMKMKSGSYHRKCFSCFECRRMLNYSTATDGPNNKVYCNPCYQRNFGPQTLRSDTEAMYKTDIIKPADGLGGCPNCGGTVFDAEKVVSKHGSYHKICAKCTSCRTNLDSISVRNGMDGKIYCYACNGKKFGGTTYRGTLAQLLVDGNTHTSLGK